MEGKVLALQENEPYPGWASKAFVRRIIDGDTIEVEVRKKFAIRVADPRGRFNVAELNTAKGKEAKQFVSDLLMPCGEDKKITIFIPAGPGNMDINSFNRLVGEIWVDGKRFTDILMENGFGKLE